MSAARARTQTAHSRVNYTNYMYKATVAPTDTIGVKKFHIKHKTNFAINYTYYSLPPTLIEAA